MFQFYLHLPNVVISINKENFNTTMIPFKLIDG